jgi:GDP-L-fucose synthase
MREFLWSEEMAEACVYCIENINFSDVRGTNKEVRNTHLNIGTGKDISIKDWHIQLRKLLATKAIYTLMPINLMEQ